MCFSERVETDDKFLPGRVESLIQGVPPKIRNIGGERLQRQISDYLYESFRFYEIIVTKFYLECWTPDKVSNSVPESYLVPVLGHNFQVEIEVGTPQRRIQPTCNRN